MVAHTRGLKEGNPHPTTAAVGCPTVLAMGHIGSAVHHIDSLVPNADSSRGGPGETGIESAGEREVAGAGQRGGSNLTMVVECSCSHRTYKSLAFRILSK